MWQINSTRCGVVLVALLFSFHCEADFVALRSSKQGGFGMRYARLCNAFGMHRDKGVMAVEVDRDANWPTIAAISG